MGQMGQERRIEWVDGCFGWRMGANGIGKVQISGGVYLFMISIF